jgi:heme exporter protein D
MSRFFALYLSILIVLITVNTGGCSIGEARAGAALADEMGSYDKPLPTDVASLRKELAATQDREARISIALKHAEDVARQTEIWIGVGACVLAGIVLIVLGIWTTRRVLVEIGIGAFALAALGALVAWLVPYFFWIGIGVALIVIAAAVYMLLNREKALTQVTHAVDDAKESIPEFKAGYKRIFQSHIDTAMDRIVHSVRGET